ncbi:unnamed protein product, partial [Ectocarpus fasciculatus]
SLLLIVSVSAVRCRSILAVLPQEQSMCVSSSARRYVRYFQQTSSGSGRLSLGSSVRTCYSARKQLRVLRSVGCCLLKQRVSHTLHSIADRLLQGITVVLTRVVR